MGVFYMCDKNKDDIENKLDYIIVKRRNMKENTIAAVATHSVATHSVATVCF